MKMSAIGGDTVRSNSCNQGNYSWFNLQTRSSAKTYNINQLAESSSIDLTRCFVGGSMHFSSDNGGGISVSVGSQAGDSAGCDRAGPAW